jgi:hypothetical protein
MCVYTIYIWRVVGQNLAVGAILKETVKAKVSILKVPVSNKNSAV